MMYQPTDLPILFQNYPHLNKDIPKISLGKFPTPVHRLANLERALGFDFLWIKRDDLSSPSGGGNKVRKLEYLLADARGKGCEILFTVGAKGSNHVRATATYAKALGFRVGCLLYNQPQTEYSERNFQEICAQADQVETAKNIVSFVLHYGMESFKRLGGRDKSRYIVPLGSSSPLGCLGYVDAAFELKAQIDAGMLPEPRLIFVALGTCGTMAGLVAGAKLAGLQGKIIGVRVVPRVVANAWSVMRLARNTLRLIGVSEAISTRDIEIWQEDFGRGYAMSTEASRYAVQMMQEYEDIEIENTYTGKTLAGLIHYVKARGCENQPILFWNTYGQGSTSV